MSKTTEDYIRLSDRISWKNIQLVSETLSSNTDLDMTHDDGEFFTLSIKSGNVAITRLLIQYYETVQLPKLEVNSPEYNLLKFRFKNALETAIEGRTLSDEMKALLSKYIDFDHDLDEDFTTRNEAAVLADDDIEGLSSKNPSSDHSTNSSLTRGMVEQVGQEHPVALDVWLLGQQSTASDVGDHYDSV
jgi:hypothetical protein